MVTAPEAPDLPVSALAACFQNVTNSYKFYWFLAILERVRAGQGPILPIADLLAEMTASVWYPTNYFRLSFGKQDQLGRVVTLLGRQAGLAMDSPRGKVIETVRGHLAQNDRLGRRIWQLGDYVPYRFLRPFFSQALRGEEDWRINRRIQQLAAQAFESAQPGLYRFLEQPVPAIEIHPRWYHYLQQHVGILTDFCLWHLVNYVQRNNPNVPNVGVKLFEPQARNLNLARRFWDLVLQLGGTLHCIFSGRPLQPGAFTIDHFLPWRFTAHDLLWNLIPAPKEVNSAKSDNLPDPIYLEPFARQQYHAVQVAARTPQAGRLLEDYLLLLQLEGVNGLQELSFPTFHDALLGAIKPQMQIAANLGFPTGWRYTP